MPFHSQNNVARRAINHSKKDKSSDTVMALLARAAPLVEAECSRKDSDEKKKKRKSRAKKVVRAPVDASDCIVIEPTDNTESVIKNTCPGVVNNDKKKAAKRPNDENFAPPEAKRAPRAEQPVEQPAHTESMSTNAHLLWAAYETEKPKEMYNSFYDHLHDNNMVEAYCSQYQGSWYENEYRLEDL